MAAVSALLLLRGERVLSFGATEQICHGPVLGVTKGCAYEHMRTAIARPVDGYMWPDIVGKAAHSRVAQRPTGGRIVSKMMLSASSFARVAASGTLTVHATIGNPNQCATLVAMRGRSFKS